MDTKIKLEKNQYARECKNCGSFFVFEKGDITQKRRMEIVDYKWRSWAEDEKILGISRKRFEGMKYKPRILLYDVIKCPLCDHSNLIKVNRVVKRFKRYYKEKEIKELENKFIDVEEDE